MNTGIDVSDSVVQEKISIILIGSALLLIGSTSSIGVHQGDAYLNIGAVIFTIGALLLIKELYTEIQ